jgi:nitroimidazol reductase NimA-like FMN-containing flavoprotein (pyridoxamine 5'-phosphate oxidase superfamily)
MTVPHPELAGNDAIRDEILQFMARPVYPYLVTTTIDGTPYLRPVICVNEGFRVRMISRLASKKVQHIRRNPLVSIFWTGTRDGRQQSVMVQARVTLLTDPEAIEAFAADYRRKNPARTRPLPSGDDELPRAILSAEPMLVRADGFRGFRPVILRGDDLRIDRVPAADRRAGGPHPEALAAPSAAP